MARTIKHQDVSYISAGGEDGFVTLNVEQEDEDGKMGTTEVVLNAGDMDAIIGVLKVAARDALKADSSTEYVVKPRAPRTNKKAAKK